MKLADLAFRGAEESPPKVTIHIPRTPVVDLPPVLPGGLQGSRPPKSKRIRLGPPDIKSEPSVPPLLGKIRIPSHVEPKPSPSALRLASPAIPTSPSPIKQVAPKKEVIFAPEKAKAKAKVSAPKSSKPAAMQAQAGGMSMNDFRACRNALKKLQGNKHARLFALPVDPVRDNAPK